MSAFLDTLAAEFQIAWDDAVQATADDVALDDAGVIAFVRDVLAISLGASIDTDDLARVLDPAAFEDVGNVPEWARDYAERNREVVRRKAREKAEAVKAHLLDGAS